MPTVVEGEKTEYGAAPKASEAQRGQAQDTAESLSISSSSDTAADPFIAAVAPLYSDVNRQVRPGVGFVLFSFAPHRAIQSGWCRLCLSMFKSALASHGSHVA